VCDHKDILLLELIINYALQVLVMSVFGRMKLRFLEASFLEQRLVIRKTQFFDFSTSEQANNNMNTVLGMMASHRVGDSTDSRIITQVCTTISIIPGKPANQ
jgi:IS5 family transposase